MGNIPPWLMGLIIGRLLVASLTSSFRIRNERAKEGLGWAPQYPSFADGLPHVLKALSTR